MCVCVPLTSSYMRSHDIWWLRALRFFTLVLLLLFTYVFSVAFMQFSRGTVLEQKFFSSMGTAIWTLSLGAILCWKTDGLNHEKWGRYYPTYTRMGTKASNLYKNRDFTKGISWAHLGVTFSGHSHCIADPRTYIGLLGWKQCKPYSIITR